MCVSYERAPFLLLPRANSMLSRPLLLLAPILCVSYERARPLLLNLQPTSHVHQTISRPHLPEHTSRPSPRATPADHLQQTIISLLTFAVPFFGQGKRYRASCVAWVSLSLYLSFSLSLFLSYVCVCVSLFISFSKPSPLHSLGAHVICVCCLKQKCRWMEHARLGTMPMIVLVDTLQRASMWISASTFADTITLLDVNRS